MKKDIIAFWGYPDPQVFEKIIEDNKNCETVDLDIDINAPDAGILPEAYCVIIKNIINNAIFLKERIKVIVAAIGEEKCNSGHFASLILKEHGLNVIQTKYEDCSHPQMPTPVSKSGLSLTDKVNAVMEGIYKPCEKELIETKPTFGFWGVPPNDFRILELFPNTTHLYGWLRCVEAKRPADIDLEMYVDEDVPTVFFSQTFCAKMQMAKFLADKYNGLYIDIDDKVHRSAIAKVEAFINLR